MLRASDDFDAESGIARTMRTPGLGKNPSLAGSMSCKAHLSHLTKHCSRQCYCYGSCCGLCLRNNELVMKKPLPPDCCLSGWFYDRSF